MSNISTKHTQGPWSVGGRYAYKTVLLNARGESIASGGNNRAVQGPELEASLTLASAAPDLLAALVSLKHDMPYPNAADDELHAWAAEGNRAAARVIACRAAIAKATGGAA